MDRLRSLFGLSGASIRDDIQEALEDASTDADVSPQERTMLKNVLELHELRVADILVPRADIIAVSLDSALADVLALFRTAGHSRLPVHGENLDDPRGMVHVRDFIDYIVPPSEKDAAASSTPAEPSVASGRIDLSSPLSAAGILRPVLFVPPSMPVLDLLVKMQATRTHMALVIDEYGGTDGLVSIEDIMETIVGDIEDEHDLTVDPQIEHEADGSFTADARTSLDDIAVILDLDLAAINDAEDIDTLGGLVMTLAGRVPEKGEVIAAHADLEFEILEADPRRIKRIRIRHMAPQPETADDKNTAG
jgi:CBS domain containing-hemolysin-like protein